MAGGPRQPGSPTNYVRRLLGAGICFAPVALLGTSLTVGSAHPRESGLGVGLAVAGLLVACLNLYLAFVRPLLFAWRHGSTDEMRHVSGIPLLGTLLVSAAGVVGFADWRSAAAGLVVLVLDPGGLPWFLLLTWWDRSLWDADTRTSPGDGDV